MSDAWRRTGPLLAAAVAAAASLPGFAIPFLSDDWAQIEAAAAGRLATTPFGYFRPLYTGTFWIDLQVWGTDPRGFHLTNLVLIAAAAALVVLVLDRWTGDPKVASAAGVLFALHPYHVENAAWVAARGDPLVAVFMLLTVLEFDRWLSSSRRLPIATLALAETALLSKESAVGLPAILAIRAWILSDAVSRRRAVRLGVVPVLLITALHFVALRPWVLGGAGRNLAGGFGIAWIKSALGLAAAGLLPLDVERLARRPILWGAVALGAWLILGLAARIRSGRLPPAFPVAILVMAVLGIPHVIGFQERYLFLPAAASCAAIVILASSGGRRFAGIAVVAIACGWVAGAIEQWRDWGEAARAGRRLIGDLVAAAGSPGVEEIVVANLPFRVRGGSVAGNFTAALAHHGSRPLPVRVASWISYPSATAPALADPPGRPPEAAGGEVVVRLQVTDRLFSGWVAPALPPLGAESRTAEASLLAERPGVVRVGLRPGRGRALYAWDRGRLVPLEVESCPADPDRPESPHAW